MPTIKINQTLMIESNGSETLLETMENAGLNVEYNCRDGHCGACRCKLSAGSVEYVGFAIAYTQSDEILPCICRASGEQIELQDVHYEHKVKRA